MANTKISGLTATTTLDDTDEYPLASSGTTKKITGANIKAAVAPVGATYLVQTASSGLSAEQAMGALGTGIVKNTTTTGVQSIAVGSDLPSSIPIAKLADPTTGKFIGSVSSAAAAAFPPGHIYSYVEITTTATTTQTTRASADTWITAASITFDGSTAVWIEAGFSGVGNSATSGTIIDLWEDSTDLGILIQSQCGVVGGIVTQVNRVKITPTAGAKVYTLRGWVTGASTGSGYAGAMTAAGRSPAYICITQA